MKHNGNLTFDEIVEIAKVMRERSMSREFLGTVKEILGTCVSVGCTVDGESPKEIQRKITDGELEVPDFH